MITDYYSYNTDVSAADQPHPRTAARAWFQPHWVGDLTLSLRLTVREPAGRFRLELIKAGVSNRCEIDLTTGEARLFHGDDALGRRRRRREITRPGTYDLTFANVDDRLTLWVDRRPAVRRRPDLSDRASEPAAPTAADLEPARIAAQGAAIAVDGLVLKRDVYYTLEPAESDYANLDEVGAHRVRRPCSTCCPTRHGSPG